MLSNILHINLRTCDDASLYNCPYSIMISDIKKWDFILKYFSDCRKMNALHLESSEQLDCLFPSPLHKLNSIYFKTYLNF